MVDDVFLRFVLQYPFLCINPLFAKLGIRSASTGMRPKILYA